MCWWIDLTLPWLLHDGWGILASDRAPFLLQLFVPLETGPSQWWWWWWWQSRGSWTTGGELARSSRHCRLGRLGLGQVELGGASTKRTISVTITSAPPHLLQSNAKPRQIIQNISALRAQFWIILQWQDQVADFFVSLSLAHNRKAVW